MFHQNLNFPTYKIQTVQGFSQSQYVFCRELITREDQGEICNLFGKSSS
jgi:hypothetical protein